MTIGSPRPRNFSRQSSHQTRNSNFFKTRVIGDMYTTLMTAVPEVKCFAQSTHSRTVTCTHWQILHRPNIGPMAIQIIGIQEDSMHSGSGMKSKLHFVVQCAAAQAKTGIKPLPDVISCHLKKRKYELLGNLDHEWFP